MNREELICAVREARQAASQLALLTGDEKNGLLQAFHDELLRQQEQLLLANREDLSRAKDYDLSPAMTERLTLTEQRVADMAEGAAALMALPDPCGRTLARWTLPNGLEVIRTTVPFGVIAMIYESRPNVTADAAALCLKSGNACVLRGGKEAHFTNAAMTEILHDVLRRAGLPEAAVTSILDPDRRAGAAAAHPARAGGSGDSQRGRGPYPVRGGDQHRSRHRNRKRRVPHLRG